MSDVQYVELHGDRVAYREAGSGEVVLLIHGMAGSSDAWQAVLPELAQHYRVIAPDLLGHGQSVKPRTDYSLGAFAASLRDLLDELGISRANIVRSRGTRMGNMKPQHGCEREGRLADTPATPLWSSRFANR